MPATENRALSNTAILAIAWILFDHAILAGLNIVRLAGVAPLNVYISYVTISLFFLLSIYVFSITKNFPNSFIFYLLIIFSAIFFGFFNLNKNIFIDLRFYIMGFFALYIFSRPVVIGYVIEIPNKFLDVVLIANTGILVFIELFLKNFSGVGYGLGTPAYLLAFYYSRGCWVRSAICLALLFHQQKRGFFVAVAAMIILSYLLKKRRSGVWFTAITCIILALVTMIAFNPDFLVRWGETDLAFRLGLDEFLAGDLTKTDLLEARFEEYVRTLELFSGVDWFFGQGLGFEFTRVKWSGDLVTDGYTHTSIYNYYLVAGVPGVSIMLFLMVRAVLRWRRLYLQTGKAEMLNLALVAFVASCFSFWSAVEPLFWVALASVQVPGLRNRLLGKPKQDGKSYGRSTDIAPSAP